MKTRFFSAVIFLTIIFSNYSVSAAKQKPIIINLNNTNLYLEQDPIIENNTALVPFRDVLEAMGVSVEWNAKTKKITCRKKTKVVELSIGSKQMFVNKNLITLDVAPKIINNRTLIPLRAVSQAFDAEVEWDSKAKIIEIKTNDTTQKDIIKSKIKNTGTQSQLHSIINQITEKRTDLTKEASEEFVTLLNQITAFERTVKSYGNITDDKKLKEVQNQYKHYIKLLLRFAGENNIDI